MGGLALSFADVVGDEEEFFRTYFNKEVLYRPRGITGDPRQILSIADMDDIVHQEGMRSSQLRMLGNGVPAIGDQLTTQLEMRREGKTIDDAIDPGKIYAHFRAGKTLIHGGLNLTRPNLRALARSMTDRFAAKSEVVAFLTPAGQRGATHSDPTDVYVIQLEGTKRWQIWPTPQVRRPRRRQGLLPLPARSRSRPVTSAGRRTLYPAQHTAPRLGRGQRVPPPNRGRGPAHVGAPELVTELAAGGTSGLFAVAPGKVFRGAGVAPEVSKSTSRRFPVTVTHLPVTRCQICRQTVAYRPGSLSQVLTEHYRRAHPETLGITAR